MKAMQICCMFAATLLSGCVGMPADPSKMTPEQLKALAADRSVTVICSRFNTPWGPQQSVMITSDRGVLQQGSIGVDQECKTSYQAEKAAAQTSPVAPSRP